MVALMFHFGGFGGKTRTQLNFASIQTPKTLTTNCNAPVVNWQSRASSPTL